MKVLFSIILCMLLTVTLNGQEMAVYNINNIATINLPKDYQITDTLGVKVVVARIDNHILMITQVANAGKNAVDILNDKNLIEFYTEYRKEMIATLKASLINSEIITKDKLILQQYTYEKVIQGDNHVMDCLGLHVKNMMYIIQFRQLQSERDQLQTDRFKFFASLHLNRNLTHKDQFTRDETTSNKKLSSYQIGYIVGQMVGRVFIYFIIFALVAVLIIWIIVRAGRKR